MYYNISSFCLNSEIQSGKIEKILKSLLTRKLGLKHQEVQVVLFYFLSMLVPAHKHVFAAINSSAGSNYLLATGVNISLLYLWIVPIYQNGEFSYQSTPSFSHWTFGSFDWRPTGTTVTTICTHVCLFFFYKSQLSCQSHREIIQEKHAAGQT